MWDGWIPTGLSPDLPVESVQVSMHRQYSIKIVKVIISFKAHQSDFYLLFQTLQGPIPGWRQENCYFQIPRMCWQAGQSPGRRGRCSGNCCSESCCHRKSWMPSCCWAAAGAGAEAAGFLKGEMVHLLFQQDHRLLHLLKLRLLQQL